MPRPKLQPLPSLGRAIAADHRRKLADANRLNRNVRLTDFAFNGKEVGKKSVVERKTLDEYIATSLAAQADFQVERPNLANSRGEAVGFSGNIVKERVPGCATVASNTAANDVHVEIPRRPVLFCGPNFNIKSLVTRSGLTAEGLDELEQNAFLNWRRKLSQLEEEHGLIMTPFEKNIELWRQLWRVAERSDIIVSVVDARDPTFYRCKDLELYIKELDPFKSIVLLLNKSDFLSREQRRLWYNYLSHKQDSNQVDVEVVFFSAFRDLYQQGLLVDGTKEEPTMGTDSSRVRSFGNERRLSCGTDVQQTKNEETQAIRIDANEVGHGDLELEEQDGLPWDILNCDQLLRFLSKRRKEVLDEKIRRSTIVQKLKQRLQVEKSRADVRVATREKEARLTEERQRRDKHRPEKLNKDNKNAKRDSKSFVMGHTAETKGKEEVETVHSTVPGDSEVRNCRKDEFSGSNSKVQCSLGRNEDYSCLFDRVRTGAEYESDNESDNSGGAGRLRDPTAENVVECRETTRAENSEYNEGFIVGMVGFPNVGKSSIINAILGSKKASVSRQPGKTKHFQTLILPGDSKITLCDCPGLVFPSFVSTKEYLVVKGVTPIDHYRGDYVAPVRLLCNRIGRQMCEFYGLNQLLEGDDLNCSSLGGNEKRMELGQWVDGNKFLAWLAMSRGYVSGGKGGLPDTYRSAKIVLRDYCTGKLIDCESPPDSRGEFWEEEERAKRFAIGRQTKIINAQRARDSALENSSHKDEENERKKELERTREVAARNLVCDFDDFDQILLEQQVFCGSAGDPPCMTKRKQRALMKKTMKGKHIVEVPMSGCVNSNIRGMRQPVDPNTGNNYSSTFSTLTI